MNELHGNVGGIKDTILEEIKKLYEYKMNPQEFASDELLEELARLTEIIGKEISVFLSRSGKVLDVSVGDARSVQLPYMRIRRGTAGVSGIRALHTHPNGSPMLSNVDVGSLISTRFDAMAAISVKNSKATAMCVGFLGDKLDEVKLTGPFRLHRIPQLALMQEVAAVTERVSELVSMKQTEQSIERVVLVGLNAQSESMEELRRLAQTAGVEAISVVTQNRERDRAYYIGKGKAQELSLELAACGADAVIFNDELTPLETRNLEEILGVKVVDRTMLILDIFAARACTREGSLQVELAQLKYTLPRLMGEGVSLSRLGGGIGTRGPGEKKIEVDRRRIRRRIFELQQEIEKMAEQRELRRAARKENDVSEIALVGYTNAGKSSLLNALCSAGVLAEDKLFATLDPVTRKVELANMGEAVFTDTVGFIEKLPHDLISAFRSTLEEATRADLLLCVTDAANANHQRQMEVVSELLISLGAEEKPKIIVMNKADKLKEIPENSENVVYISAKTGEGIEALLALAAKKLAPVFVKFDGVIGYERGDLLALVNRYGKQNVIEYETDGIHVEAMMPKELVKKLSK
ncbi:MAG: GTPase HflX [Christensenella sp.]